MRYSGYFAVLGILVYEQAHYVGADEARSACDDYVTLEFHDLFLFYQFTL